MPRANRYILPGYCYHLTHRCHNRSFLFRFAKDRTEYQRRLRHSVQDFDVSLLTYCITSNHTHLLLRATEPETVSRFMQRLEGEFAEYYNHRKKRSGAFWEGRYGCTMVDCGDYVWNCMKYIDLNMVRAGVVHHPREWRWCGYQELIGQRQRYRLLDLDQVVSQCGGGRLESFRRSYEAAISEAIDRRHLHREAWWTESIAVGRESSVRDIEQQTVRRVELTVEESAPSQWTVRETEGYNAFSAAKNDSKVPQAG